MKRDCSTCVYKEGSCYPSTTIFDKDKTCKSYDPNYEGYIADLEKENAEYKELFGDCSTCKRTCDMGNCCDPRTKNGYLVDKVKVITERQKLLKENTELELKLEALKGQTPWKDIKDKSEVIGKLTKAKELLERLLITSCNSDVINLLPNCSEVLRVRAEAEQFLKEYK